MTMQRQRTPISRLTISVWLFVVASALMACVGESDGLFADHDGGGSSAAGGPAGAEPTAGGSPTGGAGGATTSTSIGGSGGNGAAATSCDPTHPAAGCGLDMHCEPTPTGEPLCSGPTGAGQQNTSCLSDDDCAPALTCVSVDSSACCMSWCTADGDCPTGATCTSLSTQVYVGQQEYGVCFDPFGCLF